MILISTLRKMIQRNPAARVARMRVDGYPVTFPDGRTVQVPPSVEFFVTDQQLNHANLRAAEICTALKADPAKLIHIDYVPANEAAIAQGFDFLR